MFAIQHSDRDDATDQIHIVTTGRFDTPFEREVDLLRQADVSIYSIGIGDVDTTQLTSLHRRAKQPSYFWHTTYFSGYPVASDLLYDTVCNGAPKFDPPPVPIQCKIYDVKMLYKMLTCSVFKCEVLLHYGKSDR